MSWVLRPRPPEPEWPQPNTGPRSFWQRCWDWFDGLSDIQTTAFLSTVLLGLVGSGAVLVWTSLNYPPRPTPLEGQRPIRNSGQSTAPGVVTSPFTQQPTPLTERPIFDPGLSPPDEV